MCRIAFALFFGLLIVVENAVVEKRDDDGCYNLSECLSPIIATGTDSAISHEEAINEICGKVENVEQCISQNISMCYNPEFRGGVLDEIRLIRYFCSPTGRQAVFNLVQSECFGDELKLSELNIQLRNCSDVFAQQASTVEDIFNGLFPLVSQLKNCMTGRTESLCGQDYSQYIGDIFEVTTREDLEGSHCNRTERNVRHMLKRAIPFALSLNRKSDKP